ncbi:hypothetical protein ABZ953_15420 [Streptomyces sp. NPDC046465]|uniref:hypothetical protein n=1 Tax=Streptomyces sp. NPDC046465 TaxID=3155810 RepID=UPI0033D27199
MADTGTDTDMAAGEGAGTGAGTEHAGKTFTIAAAYQGYPGIALGGYVAGLLVGRTDAGAVRVDFRAATRVETPLRFDELADGVVRLSDTAGTELVTATPVRAPSTTDAPAPPTPAEARTAAEAFRAAGLAGLDAGGASIDCFGCGHRPPDQGVHQQCMGVPGRGLVATAWTPHPAFADARGSLRPEALWAALDCPTAWAGIHLGTLRRGAVTASLTATSPRPVTAGEEHITYAWPISTVGRKHTMGVAVATSAGELCTVGEALWIDPRERSRPES